MKIKKSATVTEKDFYFLCQILSTHLRVLILIRSLGHWENLHRMPLYSTLH